MGDEIATRTIILEITEVKFGRPSKQSQRGCFNYRESIYYCARP